MWIFQKKLFENRLLKIGNIIWWLHHKSEILLDLIQGEITDIMEWDPMTVTGSSEPLYFGPLAGYDTDELDRRGLDQDKKTTKGFKWLSKKEPTGKAVTSVVKVEQKTPTGPPVKAWDDPPPTPEQGQKLDPDGVPTWDEFTQTTTFHGVRYIFDKSPNKLRRYGLKFSIYFVNVVHRF